MLDTHHGLNALEVKHWQALQQDAVHILHLRHIQLPDMEKRLGSPPSQRKPGMPTRHRLTGKQPPTPSCPTAAPRPTKRMNVPGNSPTMLAEEHPVGEWHFNGHYIVALPHGNAQDRQALLCLNCRRSASLQRSIGCSGLKSDS